MIRFIKNVLAGKKKPTPDAERFQAHGNLVHGVNCKLDKLRIHIQGARRGQVNIQIGNDCFISGSVVMHNPDAKLVIGDGVFIGPDTTIFCYESVSIDNDVMISWGCTLIDTNAHSLHSAERSNDVRDWIRDPSAKNWSVVRHAPVHIKNKSWIGFKSIVTKGVVMGEGTVLGCGSVLSRSTEPFSVYAGNPAVKVKDTD